ncbi:MAG: RHS repeat-associated core domain-containing protein, partial [Clostridia bacterium]|nr:RHS repeat-associated core domain-containing protein [Clostridia bacterium]
YDDNGNMLEKRLTPFVDSTAQTQIVKLTNVYDRFNQLTMSITDDGKTVCNTYNGEGLRIRKDVNGVATNYLYEGMKVVAEYDGEYNLGAQNVQGLNLLMRVEQNATYYYMYNGHADATALLNAQTGNTDATYYYDAFGTVLSQTGNVSNSYLYAGYQYDEETGLYYLNARMYDSATARFVQEDTYRGNPNDPLSLNLYTYCANNPLVYHDPTGHSLESIWGGVKKTGSWAWGKVKTGKDKTVSAGKAVVNSVGNFFADPKGTLNNAGEAVTKTAKSISGKAKVFGAIAKNKIKSEVDYVAGFAVSSYNNFVIQPINSVIGMVSNLFGLVSSNNSYAAQPTKFLDNVSEFIEQQVAEKLNVDEKIFYGGKVAGDVAAMAIGSFLVKNGVENIEIGLTGVEVGKMIFSTGVGEVVGAPEVAISGTVAIAGAVEAGCGSLVSLSSSRNMGSDMQ